MTMTDRERAEHQAQTNAEIDFDDPMTAFYTGCRELTEAEYEQCAAAHHADMDRKLAADQADAEYAAWAQANPEAHAQAVADHEAQVEANHEAGAEPF